MLDVGCVSGAGPAELKVYAGSGYSGAGVSFV
jgi:hypothetical protein